jgi:glycosyltransferase involved in cell wall biosynthesis
VREGIALKIAQITSTILPYRYGGRERHVYYLSKHLAKLGHDITIYTANSQNGISRERFENINLCRIPSISIPLPYSKLGLYLRISPLLHKVLMKDEPDLIHLHDYGSFTLGATLATTAKKRPLVVTMHGPLGARSWPTIPRKFKLLFNFYDYSIFRFTLSRAFKVIAVSQHVRYSLLESRLIKCDKVIVIPNGVDMGIVNFANASRFKRQYGLDDKKIILCVGRIIKEKGYWRLAMISPNILERWREHARIILIGPDEGYLCQLKKLFKKYNAEDIVVYLGRVSDQILSDAYAAADIFAMTSDIEGLPIRLLEAMAFGKAIVAIKAGEINHLIENYKDGILVDPSDIYGFHQAIDFLLGNDMLREHLGFNAKEKARQYDWRHVVKSINAIYEQAVG